MSLLDKFRKLDKPRPDEQEDRKYYEVWGDSLEQVQFLKRGCLGLIFICVLLLVLLNRAQEKPPLVIRVNEMGNAEPLKNPNADHRLTKPEILNFTRLFLKFFLERDVHTWRDNLEEAGAMMASEFRDKANRMVDFDEETQALQDLKLTSALILSNVEVTRETKTQLFVSVKGYRKITSYDDPALFRETIFTGKLVFGKTTRTLRTPYGLLVEDYVQTDFKNE